MKNIHLNDNPGDYGAEPFAWEAQGVGTRDGNGYAHGIGDEGGTSHGRGYSAKSRLESEFWPLGMHMSQSKT